MFDNIKTTKSTLLLAAAAVTILNFESCKKYEDGPAFSLRSKKARLTGEWELVKINGQSPEQYYGYSSFYSLDIEWEFESDNDFKSTMSYSYNNGSYSYSYSYSYKGEWEWEDNKEAIEISLDGYSSSDEYEIKRLTNKELTIEYENNVEWEFEKK